MTRQKQTAFDPDTFQRTTVPLRARHIVALDRTCLSGKAASGKDITRAELLAAIIEVADLESALQSVLREKTS